MMFATSGLDFLDDRSHGRFLEQIPAPADGYQSNRSGAQARRMLQPWLGARTDRRPHIAHLLHSLPDQGDSLGVHIGHAIDDARNGGAGHPCLAGDIGYGQFHALILHCYICGSKP